MTSAIATGRSRLWRLIGASALLIVPGSCLAPAAAPPAAAPGPVVAPPVATPPPAALPVPVAAATAPAATTRADFDLAGEARQGGTLVGFAPTGTRTLTLDGATIPLAADGAFLLAFDRDAGTGARLVATLAGGRTVERFLPVASGNWRIERVDAAMTGGAGTSAEFARRRPAELEQINAARRVRAESDGWRQPFIRPVAGRQSGYFGSQRIYRGVPGSYHSGADIAAAAGTPFVAPADGVVVLAAAAPFTLEGNLLIVDHGMGLTSAFLHCQRLDVAVGDVVRQGQRLGTVGMTGRATGPHLHWGMKWGAARLDPMQRLTPQ